MVYGVILHAPEFGNRKMPKVFTDKSAAKRYARKVARAHDITANAAVFKIGTQNYEWEF